ncbi:MAG: helix-turn-helix transcriptional regulator [Limnohabitans sp.]|nr:helix-turn-helix transcriptional regulator [Limnohabitans sp.]
MEERVKSELISKNHLKKTMHQSEILMDWTQQLVEAISRMSFTCLYVIDYTTMTFEYVSPHPLFLCGNTVEEVKEMGYTFYFKHIPENELQMLHMINEEGFNFYEKLAQEDRLEYAISYDFHLVHKNGNKKLVNHQLTPLLLTEEGKLWKAICMMKTATSFEAGNVIISKQNSKDTWQLDLVSKVWSRIVKPELTDKELETLKKYAQGFSIDEIAQQLFVSLDSVKYYRRKIFEKFEVKNMQEALGYALHHKII